MNDAKLGNKCLDITQQITAPKRKRFLVAYLAVGSIRRAAKETGISTRSHYDWYRDDPVYRSVFDNSARYICHFIHDGLVERLANGWEEPVYHQGEQVGSKRKFDNATALNYLKAAKFNGFEEQPTQVNVDIDVNQPAIAVFEIPDNGRLEQEGD